jgi:hypothetical protein
VLENPSSRLWVHISGSHADEASGHVEWLLDPRTHDFDLADTLCFVRKDLSDDLLDQTAAIVRGDSPGSFQWRAAIDEAPASSWFRLAEYVRACSRMNVHCTNEGQVLMVLSWVEELQRRFAERAIPGVRQGAAKLFEALLAIESVKKLERSRFSRVLGRAPKGRVQDRLVELWQRTRLPAHAADPEGRSDSGDAGAR